MKKTFFAILVLFLSLGISSNVSAMSLTDEEGFSWEVIEDPAEDSYLFTDEGDFTWEVIEESLEDGYVFTDETFGLSDRYPFSEIEPFGVNRPSKVWNIANSGRYNFAGSTNGQTLYTNYKFKGKTSYTIRVNNTSDKPMTVKAKRPLKTYATTKISGGKSATIQFSNIKSSTEFYITFDGKGISLDGYIR